jgi:hypothetical protein
MPSRKPLFTGVGKGVTKITNEATWADIKIPETGAHASNALKRAGWDGKTPMAAVMMTADITGLKGKQWILRGSLVEISVPLQRIQEDKTMRVTLDLKDLSKVKFPTVVNPTTGGANPSDWIDGATVASALTMGATTLTEASAVKNSSFMKSKGFSLR